MISQKIVIPNVMLKDVDKELFHMNFLEFIRKDMETEADLRIFLVVTEYKKQSYGYFLKKIIVNLLVGFLLGYL